MPPPATPTARRYSHRVPDVPRSLTIALTALLFLLTSGAGAAASSAPTDALFTIDERNLETAMRELDILAAQNKEFGNLQVKIAFAPSSERTSSSMSSTLGGPARLDTALGPTRIATLSFPFHGRYCGPGHSGPGTPVDRLDSACRTHDRCYASQGYGSRSCDITLMRWIVTNYNSLSGSQKAKAAIIYGVFYAKGYRIVGLLVPTGLGR